LPGGKDHLCRDRKARQPEHPGFLLSQARASGSFTPAFEAFAVVIAVILVAVAFVRPPRRVAESARNEAALAAFCLLNIWAAS